jgi:hypothetical protein
MSFDPQNTSLNIQDSIGFPIPKVGIHWECVGSFPHTFKSANVTLRWHSQLTPFHAFALVVN